MQNIAAMLGSQDMADRGPGAARTEPAEARPPRRPYQAPRIERRIPIVANTLISGNECTLPGDPCD